MLKTPKQRQNFDIYALSNQFSMPISLMFEDDWKKKTQVFMFQ